LVQALKWSRERGGTITVSGLQPHIAKVFEMVGFDKVFSISA
jgi:anti-anti-sigma regulatory factor